MRCLRENLLEAWKNGEDCDFIIYVEGREIKTNKFILNGLFIQNNGYFTYGYSYHEKRKQLFTNFYQFLFVIFHFNTLIEIGKNGKTYEIF